MENKTSKKSSLIGIVIITALLVGTLDLSAAFVDYYISAAKNPIPVVSKYIASGVFGMNAFSGGTGMIVMGILFHYIIASSFTFFFFWLYTRTTLIPRNKILAAVLYGIFMWVITVLIVLPLSNVPPRKPFEFLKVLKSISILIVMIGLPLTIVASKYFVKKKATQTISA